MQDTYIKNLEDNIVERIETIQVGTGEFDKIGIHRVTKDICGCGKATVVAIPGANSDFNTSFLKMAIYLAKHDIDVWGIDFRYSFVPNNTPEGYPYCIALGCNFMRDWNINLHLSDLNNVVRLAELSSRNGNVFLIGFSQGASFSYKYAERYPTLQGIIPIDIAHNIDPIYTDYINATRAEVYRLTALMNTGIYYQHVLENKYITTLALSNPDGQSPIIPGFTNRQAFLFAVTMTYRLPAYNPPNFRQAQGDLIGLKHTDYNFIIQQALNLNSFQPLAQTVERYTIRTTTEIPNVQVPILYVGSEFGFGNFGLYTPNRIHEFNPDVNTIIVPDYGHADLMYSNTAETDIWKDILKWIKDHKK